jgi:hypothetical protein
MTNKLPIMVIVLLGFAGATRGGTVITANLPPGSAIINIDGTADGAANYSFNSPGDFQTRWYQPFNTSGNLLEFTVQPGTYALRVIDPTDAHSIFPSLKSIQLNQIYTSWTFNRPWISTYLAFDDSAKSNPNESQLIYGAIGLGFAGDNAADAYQAAKTGNGGQSTPWFNQFYAGEAFHSPLDFEYTFTSVETLIFAVPDYFLPDNSGGVSVLISAAVPVPEPTGTRLSAVALFCVAVAACRKPRKLKLALA